MSAHHLGHHLKLQKQGMLAAGVCALCFILGVATLQWLAPEIYQFPEGRLRIINNWGWGLHLWNFAVFPLIGLSVLSLNRALVKTSTQPLGKFATLCTVVSCIALAHDIAIFTIETMSNELLVRRAFNNDYEQAELTLVIFSLLNKLRASSEWGIDLWLCLINLFLLKQKRFHPALQLLGITVGVMGVLALTSLFHNLMFIYLYGMISWFAATSIGLGLTLRRSKSTTTNEQDNGCNLD